MKIVILSTEHKIEVVIELPEGNKPIEILPMCVSVAEPVRTKRKYERHKTLNFTTERDRIIRDNFDVLGHSGIFDKSLLPGFSLAEIRQRCIELKLLDKFGVRPEKRGKHGAETA